jgi:hypothetical protein
MLYTFDALRREVLRNLDEEDDSATTEQLAGDFLNQAHQVRAIKYANHFLLYPRALTLITQVGVQRYTLSPLVDRLLYLRNDSQATLMREIPNRGLSSGEFDWAAETGSASEFMFWGHSPVAAQPSSASVLVMISSSTSDTSGTASVVVKGVTSSGDIVAEEFSMNGTTAVTGTTEFVEILSIVKSGEFAGTLTIVSNGGDVTILTLGAFEMGKQYRQIYLVQSPDTPETLSYRFYRKPLILINDFDVPDLPSPYSQLLVWDALLLFGGYNTDIRSETLSMWRDQRDQWEEALESYLRDVSTLGAQPLFVQNREGDFSSDWPTFGAG